MLTVFGGIASYFYHLWCSRGWYYAEKNHPHRRIDTMTLFVATNQAFFMGFFFFISAYFTESSYHKKGAVPLYRW